MTPKAPDFHPFAFDATAFSFDLNNREIAVLVWLTAIALVLLLWKPGRSGAASVMHAFLAWKLQAIFAAMTLYAIGTVVLLAQLNLWEWTNAKTTFLCEETLHGSLAISMVAGMPDEPEGDPGPATGRGRQH